MEAYQRQVEVIQRREWKTNLTTQSETTDKVIEVGIIVA